MPATKTIQKQTLRLRSKADSPRLGLFVTVLLPLCHSVVRLSTSMKADGVTDVVLPTAQLVLNESSIAIDDRLQTWDTNGMTQPQLREKTSQHEYELFNNERSD
jgi:hypothetical protein